MSKHVTATEIETLRAVCRDAQFAAAAGASEGLLDEYEAQASLELVGQGLAAVASVERQTRDGRKYKALLRKVLKDPLLDNDLRAEIRKALK